MSFKYNELLRNNFVRQKLKNYLLCFCVRPLALGNILWQILDQIKLLHVCVSGFYHMDERKETCVSKLIFNFLKIMTIF